MNGKISANQYFNAFPKFISYYKDAVDKEQTVYTNYTTLSKDGTFYYSQNTSLIHIKNRYLPSNAESSSSIMYFNSRKRGSFTRMKTSEILINNILKEEDAKYEYDSGEFRSSLLLDVKKVRGYPDWQPRKRMLSTTIFNSEGFTW